MAVTGAKKGFGKFKDYLILNREDWDCAKKILSGLGTFQTWKEAKVKFKERLIKVEKTLLRKRKKAFHQLHKTYLVF